MYFAQDDECCTQVVLTDFGEETVTYNDQIGKKYSPCAPDFPEFVKRLRTKVNAYNANVSYDWGICKKPTLDTLAIITATTLDTQPIAEGFLKQFGFRKYGPITRTKYSIGQISLWFLSVPVFFKKLKKHEKRLK